MTLLYTLLNLPHSLIGWAVQGVGESGPVKAASFLNSGNSKVQRPLIAASICSSPCTALTPSWGLSQLSVLSSCSSGGLFYLSTDTKVSVGGVQKAEFELRLKAVLGTWANTCSTGLSLSWLKTLIFLKVYFLKNWIYNISVLYKSIYSADKHNCSRGNMLDTSF